MCVDDVIYQLESLKENSLSFIDGCDDDIWRRDVKALDAAISFLEHRREKKVKKEKTLVGKFRCPTCNAAFIEEFGKADYCGHCGQRLDWSE